ncbi:MAG: 4Fe-4S binding protein [Ignavibacteria bacterium]|jgi:polyferredoxin
MNFSLLKKLRVIVSLVSIITISLLFIDFHELIPESAYQYILYFQFVPSFIKFISSPALIASGFLVILVITVLFGRVYCSSFCPLGIFIDIINFLKTRKRKKKRFQYNSPNNFFRYPLLFLTVVFILSGSLLFVNILDPYSNFGKFSNTIIKPLIVLMNNVISIGLESFDNYSIPPYDYKISSITGIVFILTFLALVLILTLKKGRLYCNTICPVGTFLGLLSKLSIYKIQVDENNCNGCGVCERVCKSNCISSKEKKIDFDRCVSCFNCLNACPSAGLVYKNSLKRTAAEPTVGYNRRNFLISAISLSTFLTNKLLSQNEVKVYVKNKIPEEKKFPVSPPGSISIDNFTSKCIACEMCVSTCPTQVLQPSLFQYGLDGILMPHLNNRTGFCNYDCIKCGEVCPTGAILPKKLEDKKLIQIGKAKFVRDNCVVVTQKSDCAACSEHCPTKAVETFINKDNLREPKVDEELCIGCGACEYACPTIPYKAIYVDGNSIHQLAKRPKQEKLEEINIDEDFPF